MELATYLPHSKEEFRQISGFGEMKVEQYGKIFWKVVTEYCQCHDLTSRIQLRPTKRRRLERPESETDTKRESLRMFQQGHSLEKIAETRDVAVSTVENHLAYYISQGRLDAKRLMDPSKIKAVQQARDQAQRPGLGAIKEILGEGYSYGDIRMALAHLDFAERAVVGDR